MPCAGHSWNTTIAPGGGKFPGALSTRVKSELPAPQGQRLLQVPHGPGRAGRLLALPQEPLGDLHISAVSAKVKDIPRWPREDGRLVPQDGTQVGHVGLQ